MTSLDEKLRGTTNRDTALAFVANFCAANIERLDSVLDERLRVRGSLYEFHSRAEYLASLRADPPEPSDYRVLSVTEGEDSVAVFYTYGEADDALIVAQLFCFKDHVIIEMRLVFDTDGMEQP